MDTDGEYAFDEDDEEPEAVDCMDDDTSDHDSNESKMEPEPSTAKVQQEAEDFNYEVLTADQIVQFMVERIKEVNAVVQIPSTITRILLNHFKWSEENLIERYYDGDQDSLFAEAHVISPYRRDQGRPAKRMTRSAASTSSDNTTCEICFDSRNTTEMSGLECGHKFCTECWCKYLTFKIIDEGLGPTISCAACDILVDDHTVMKLIHDPKVKLKYQQLLINSFVECNRLFRWCPAPDCGHAVKVAYYDTKPVTCKCGHTFCFACGENWHDPVKCVWLKKWIKKCDGDSETSNWIAANTQECPKCHVTIEKDGGSNYMICKNQNCKADFCWVCLGPWEPHGSSWDYLFYYNRYMNHMQSLKFENKLYASVQIKMEEMQQNNMSWIEVQFLKKAVDVLCSCRQTLMYTCVFAFYLKKNNQSVIFEDNQKDLENAMEQLLGYLERDISSEVLQDIKQKVQDKTRYCEGRRNVLLEHVHEGYEIDLWEYQEDL